ncbi:hypothetical protein [Paenibacillus donghaensis]|uniref:Uncharacterized protein n=1 Tax=Paenibacillus donghaensis TaxID=414771 RepID=A0A2Z2K954_9BACL|nr:hypothetical protein [Paenibacillus donghaensis]ASA21944.1 hypothetical protein B9T62_14865 [Paenibacillus donghaensis]
MQAIKRVDTNGKYMGDVPGVEQEENSVVEVVENGDLIGYNISVPFSQGFKAYVSKTNAFRFNLEAWSEPSDNPSGFWLEGLTAEEIAELTKPGELTELEQLHLRLSAAESANLDTMDALFDVYLIISGGGAK